MIDRLIKALSGGLLEMGTAAAPQVDLTRLRKDVTTDTGLSDPKAGVSHIDRKKEPLQKDTHAHSAEGGKATAAARGASQKARLASNRAWNTGSRENHARAMRAHVSAACHNRAAGRYNIGNKHDEAAHTYEQHSLSSRGYK